MLDAYIKFDFVGIGDITTDAFIRLSDAHIHKQVREEDKELCLRYGDKVPYESVTLVPATGNSANASVCASKLGLKSALVTSVGNDDFGREDIESLTKAGVATDFVQTEDGKSSNYHFILWFGSDRTILIRHETFTYYLPDLGDPKWIYLSSTGEHSIPYHNAIADYLDAHPNTKLAFQPGTFQMKAGKELLKRIYERSEILFCNTDEARRILENEETDGAKLARDMTKLGPKKTVITDGPNGLYACDGKDTWFMPPYPDIAPPFERTGAGDACSSTIASALALGEPFEKALSWGPINSAYVVQKVGAQAGLLTRAELKSCLAKAPSDYAPKKL